MTTLGRAADVCTSVLVLGSARLIEHSVGRVVAASGFTLADETSGVRPGIVVLIEPLPAHWRAVEEMDVPAVVLTSMQLDDVDVLEMVLQGAEAVLPLDCEREHLVATLRRVEAGDSALTRAQSKMLAAGVRRQARTRPHTDVTLTRREAEILQTIDHGLSVKQTARALGISPRTVENTQRVLYRKLGVKNRAQAVARAYALGLLTGESR